MFAYYFKLQLKRFTRRFEQPLIALVVLLGVIAGIGIFLYPKSNYAGPIFSGLILYSAFQLNSKEKLEFLKQLFGKNNLLLRYIETVLYALPLLLVQLMWLDLIWLVVSLTGLALIPLLPTKQLSLKVPTPFKNMPFESIVGFRNYWCLYLLILFLFFKGVQVENFVLAMVAMLSTGFLVMTFYAYTEPPEMITIFGKSPSGFLWIKLFNAFKTYLVLALPMLVILLAINWVQIGLILGLFLLGLIYSASMVLVKYLDYPGSLGLPKSILFGISIFLAPFLILAAPFLFKQSAFKLKEPWLS